MAWTLKPLRIENLEDAVALVNTTSRGDPLRPETDVPGFLVEARFWNYSYRHSRVAYVDGEPAGVVLGCIDREQSDSFTPYWGILPSYRKQRLSMAMFAHYFRGLARDGIAVSTTDVTSDPLIEMYAKLGFVAREGLVRLDWLEADPPASPRTASSISASDAAALHRPAVPGSRHWTRRPQFRRRLANSLLHAATSDGAFATFQPRADRTMVLDYHLPTPESAAALTRYVFEHGFPRPVVFPAAHPDTASCAALVQCGYTVNSRYQTMTLDLTSPNARLRHLYESFPDLPLGDGSHHP